MEYHRIVVKLGTNLLTGGTDRLDMAVVSNLVNQASVLHKKGLEIIIVTSGAIASGRQKLGIKKGSKDIPFKQVLASIGQCQLMSIYDRLFSEHNIVVAQTLLTRANISNRLGYLNTRNTLLALLDLKVIPIINENDVVAVDEISEARFGDNDNLSAMVANLIDADALIILSDVAGLYTCDPGVNKNATLIPVVECIDTRIERMASGSRSGRGTGGMGTKIKAARLATSSGVAVVIAYGHEKDVILRLIKGERIGTLFTTATDKIESRKRWMLSGLSAKGKVTIDGGALKALKEQNKSLLPAGVTSIEGQFQRGDIINIIDSQGSRIACGITNYSARDLTVIKGQRSDKIMELLGHEYGSEVVHRNNLVSC
ncbi:MAG: glutamate 5-kinase [Chloroflexi bacterium]|nr:glutamate 5-kinase [Chloroflexota bacterium]